jgi:hypothetical protein
MASDEVARLTALVEDKNRQIAAVKERAKLFVAQKLEASSSAEADSAQKVAQLTVDLEAATAKIDEVKNKAKVFVREKLASVQEHLKKTELRHSEFVAQLSSIVPATGSIEHVPLLADTRDSLLSTDERLLLRAVATTTNPAMVTQPRGADTPHRTAMNDMEAQIAQLQTALQQSAEKLSETEAGRVAATEAVTLVRETAAEKLKSALTDKEAELETVRQTAKTQMGAVKTRVRDIY